MPKKSGAKRKPSRDFRLYTLDDLNEDDGKELYMPHGDEAQEHYGKIRKAYETLKPRSAFDFAFALAPGSSILYTLYKLKPETHKKVNHVLKNVCEFSTVLGPEAPAVTGLMYGVSQVIYGMKTKSGKHVGAGISGIAHHLENEENLDPKLKKTLKHAKELSDYFYNFNPIPSEQEYSEFERAA